MDTSKTATLTIDRSWWSWSGAHGGVLAGRVLEQIGPSVEGLHVRDLSMAFIRPIDDAPLELSWDVHQPGKSTAVASLRVEQSAQTVATGLVVLGAHRDGLKLAAVPKPNVAPPDDCPPFALPVSLIPMTQYLEIRPASPARPLAGGPDAELLAWIRLTDQRPLTPASVTILLDALPPGLYATLRAPIPIPTVHFAVHMTDALARPLGGWALVRMRTDQAGGGWSIDDSAVWAADGALLGTCRQSRRVISPSFK